ncbi:MAG: Hsp20/alpha crystallin family protein [Lentisphaeria bacterium]|nr:Hsp20/alpha crystallin family protein [Lentisphaeria bacterium]
MTTCTAVNKDTKCNTNVRYRTVRSNITKNGDTYSIYMALPGIDKEHVNLQVKDHTLYVEANKDVNGQIYAYQKSYKLSDKLDADSINASMKDGLLQLSIALKKEEVPQERRIEIQ